MTQSAMPAARGTQLTPPQLTVLRGMLEQQRRFRLDQLEQLQQSRQGSETEREITDSLVTGARAALRDVLDALQRMADGRYGRCRHCSSSLSLERLEILPQVGLCMACQRADQGE